MMINLKNELVFINLKKLQQVRNNKKAKDIRVPEKISLGVDHIVKLAFLLGLDILGLATGWYLASNHFLNTAVLPSSSQVAASLELLFLPILLLGISFLSSSKLYTEEKNNHSLNKIFKAVTLTYLSLIPLTLEFYQLDCLWQLLLAALITILLISSWRWIALQLFRFYQRHFSNKPQVILLGEKRDIERCFPCLKESQEFEVSKLLNISEFTNQDSLLVALQQVDFGKIDRILICSWKKIKESRKIAWKLRYSGTKWQIVQLNSTDSPLNSTQSPIIGMATIKIQGQLKHQFEFLIKRISDILGSFILLTIFGLPMIVIALLIKLDSPGPVFYKQTRVGLQGNYFEVWKFRTMVSNASQLQQQMEAKNEISGGVLFKIKDDPRITKIGKYLRKYSLDELPQLFNVLRGEMSLIGPRPLPVRDVDRFAPEHHDRHAVLPGITGLWQVSGRSDTDSENVFNLDFEYIQNWSLALDLQILWRTVGVVLNSRGAY